MLKRVYRPRWKRSTVLFNREIGTTSGVVLAHGSSGAFGRLIVDEASSLQVLAASDLGTG